MSKVWTWTRNGLALAGVLALGFRFGASRVVNASAYESDGMGVQFQFAGVRESSSLLVYQPQTKTVYLYQDAMTGNANVQCTYMFKMTRPGEVIRRIPCAIQQLNP